MITVAVVLASQCQYLSSISSYDAVVDDTLQPFPDDVYKAHCSMLEKRMNPIYMPLTDEKIAKFKKAKEEEVLFFKFLEIMIVIIFIVVISRVSYFYWSPTAVYSNAHARTLTAGGVGSNTENYRDIFNRSQLEDYLKRLFVDSGTLYNTRWYNGRLIHHPRHSTLPALMARDCILILVGAPTLRQVRVVGGACRFPSAFANASLQCVPAWRSGVEDTNDYDEMWNPYNWKSPNRESTVWDHSNDSYTIFPTSSPTGTLYPSGGYVAKLSTAISKTRLVLSGLLRDHWVDRRTRALFVEFTLYNVNRHEFTHVTLVAEQLAYGLVLTGAQIELVQLKVFEIVWTATFSALLLLLFVKDLLIVNRHGLGSYLSSIRNVFQVLLVCLGIACIVFFIAHDVISAGYISKLNIRKTFEFSEIITCHKVSSVFATVLFCCLVIRLLSLFWLFGQGFTVIYVTLKKSFIYVTLISLSLLASTFIYEDMINYLLSDFSSRSTSLVASFIFVYNRKHVKPSTFELSFFVWYRFVFLLIVMLLTAKYNRVYTKWMLKLDNLDVNIPKGFLAKHSKHIKTPK